MSLLHVDEIEQLCSVESARTAAATASSASSAMVLHMMMVLATAVMMAAATILVLLRLLLIVWVASVAAVASTASAMTRTVPPASTAIVMHAQLSRHRCGKHCGSRRGEVHWRRHRAIR
jgi:hypothetical protein